VCKFKQVRGKTGEFSIGFTVVNREDTLMVTKRKIKILKLMIAKIIIRFTQLRLRAESKKGKKTYTPTMIDVTFDVCELINKPENMDALVALMNLVSPQAMVFMEPFLHPCPIQVRSDE
jgi:ribosomal protein S7